MVKGKDLLWSACYKPPPPATPARSCLNGGPTAWGPALLPLGPTWLASRTPRSVSPQQAWAPTDSSYRFVEHRVEGGVQILLHILEQHRVSELDGLF